MPYATVQVEDTDCSLLGYFPHGHPWGWYFPLPLPPRGHRHHAAPTPAATSACWCRAGTSTGCCGSARERRCFPVIFERPTCATCWSGSATMPRSNAAAARTRARSGPVPDRPADPRRAAAARRRGLRRPGCGTGGGADRRPAASAPAWPTSRRTMWARPRSATCGPDADRTEDPARTPPPQVASAATR